MRSFFIEFRLHGFARNYAKWVKSHVHDRGVSHITIFGPAETTNLSAVMSEIGNICNKYTLIPFKIGSFSRFDNNASKVIYLDIEPALELEQFRWELAQSLLRRSRTKSIWDSKKQFKFHSTVKKYNNINADKFNQIYDYINKTCKLTDYLLYKQDHKLSPLNRFINFITKLFRIPEDNDQNINQHLLRITTIGRGGRIIGEYDLVLKRWLNRREALSNYWWRQTIRELKELQRRT